MTIEQRTGCFIKRGITTNGILVDDAWVELFKAHDISVTVSLDGPEEINDKYRIDFKGRGTLAQTLKDWCLRTTGFDPGLISVCNPGTDPEKVLAFVVNELGNQAIRHPAAGCDARRQPAADRRVFHQTVRRLVRQIRRARRASTRSTP